MKFYKFLIIGSVLVTSSHLYAACSPQKGFSTVDISMNVGRVVVRPSDTVGQVLKKSSFTITPNGSIYRCDNNAGTIIAELSKNPQLSSVGNNIYDTNIPGIGIRLYREVSGNGAGFSDYYPYQRTLERNKSYNLGSSFFIVELVKTATNTGSGAVSAGRYSSYYTNGYSNSPSLTSTVYGNAITIASSSCEIQGDINKIVTLPTVNKTVFSGIGSTAGEQGFDINIQCNGGQNPTDYEEKNDISLTFDYTQDNSNAQVMNNILTDSNAAKGVGVQLISNYKNQNQIIAKGDNLALGTVKSNQTVQYNIPMAARYYQTSTNISAGKVKAQATLNIQYQ